MKSAGVCIGRPVLLTSPTGQQEVSLPFLISSHEFGLIFDCVVIVVEPEADNQCQDVTFPTICSSETFQCLFLVSHRCV